MSNISQLQRVKASYGPLPGIFILLSTLIIGCDPARILVIKAEDKPDLSVTIYGSDHLLAFSGQADAPKTIIRIPTNEPPFRRDTVFYYGLGGWGGDEGIERLADNIDSIIIMSSTGKIQLSNKTDMTNYLKKKRSGFAKRILTIHAK